MSDQDRPQETPFLCNQDHLGCLKFVVMVTVVVVVTIVDIMVVIVVVVVFTFIIVIFSLQIDSY